MEFNSFGADQILRDVLLRLKDDRYVLVENSRGGPVRRFAEPVIVKHHHPLNRVMSNSARDANPFFHFMEALWMIGGMDTVAPMKRFNANIGNYSDDGSTLRGTAYGHKWRHAFGYDQLALAINRLKEDPTDRRVVMTMWDSRGEWRDAASKDLSCNLQVLFSTRPDGNFKGRILDMTVTNRSNDIVWGCLGSNLFHFSFLLEYVAAHTGLRVGTYYQISNNLHGYLENEVFKRCYEAAGNDEEWDDYCELDFTTDQPKSFLEKFPLSSDYFVISNFVNTGETSGDYYLTNVATHMWEAWRVWKLKSEKGIDIPIKDRVEMASLILYQCADQQLASTGIQWLVRKRDAALAKEKADA